MQNAETPRPKIRIVNILLAVFAIVAGALLAWGGWTLHSASALSVTAQEARTAAVAELRALLDAERASLEEQRKLPRVRDAVLGNNIDGARAALAGSWVGIEAVEIHPADITPLWANAERFGYGKLGLLVTALDRDGVQMAVVQDAGRPWLALAAPIPDENGLVGLAYVRRPLDLLQPLIDRAAPSGAYAALRQGGRSLIESGNITLSEEAERGAVALAESRLRVVGTSP